VNIHIEMPSGCQSTGYDPEDFAHDDESHEECCARVFDRIVEILSPWEGFVADVVMLNNTSVEVRRHHVEG